MAVIHICDRCGVEKRYEQVGPTKHDPMGQQGVTFNQLRGFCDGCHEEHTALLAYQQACGEAWVNNQPMPPLPELW